MTDPTIHSPQDPTEVHRPIAGSTGHDRDRDGGEGSSGLLDDVKPEEPRTNPVTYAALALALLALVLSIAALAKDDGPGYREVQIGANQCVIGEDDSAETDALYCRTENLP
jgi:hypothetical protein